MRFFSLQVFPILTTVSDWYNHFDVFFFFHLFNSTGVVAVALVNLRWKDFVSIKLSQIVSFHKLLVLAFECFFSFDNVEIHSDNFLGCICVVDILRVLGSTMLFGFGLYVSEICHSMCLCLMRSFVVQFFFIFRDIVWLVKPSYSVYCCSSHQFYWVSDRCRSEFALWWFFVRKKLASQYWQFFFLFGLDSQTFLEFS